MDENLMTEFSICIPTYEYNGDGVKYLKKLFDSLKGQTFEDYNIIISDHSKDDEIYDFCEISSNEFEIVYVKNENGIGKLGPNTNCALEFATGRIIKLIYQDDFFFDNQALEKIKTAFDTSDKKWLMNGFIHTEDEINFFRPLIPRWTDMLLEGRNLMGNPSAFSILNEYKLYTDENLNLLIDTEFYHRLRCEYGMPYIVDDILTANREHPNRMSSGGIQYDMQINHPEGGWLVNKGEYEYVTEKHKNNREYPDEN
jgi:glycosyltransferase involved in cell wall biosynthesis